MSDMPTNESGQQPLGTEQPEKKKKKVSNVMLAIIVIAIVGYVVADFILQYRMGIEISPTITTCWFCFWGTEIAALTTLKASKIIKGSTNEDMSSSDAVNNDACG